MRNFLALLLALAAISVMPGTSRAQQFGGYNTGTSTYQSRGPSYSQSPNAGYQYRLNGKVYSTNSRTMSGPQGCNSGLVDLRTGRMVCPLDSVVSPQAIWEQIVTGHCGLNEYGDSLCVGGIVAVGRNCPQNPGVCRYYRIKNTYAQLETWDVRITNISHLGDELWITRPGQGMLWRLFTECHADQFASYRRGC